MIRAALISLALLLPLPVSAQQATDRLDELFAQLAQAEEDSWEVIEAELDRLLAASGSPSMDLLLERGRLAMQDERPDDAVEHLTALTDHAPEFAEGWYARATALYLTGRVGPALADLQRTLVLEPRHYRAITGLAVILEETGKPRRALEVYRRALAIHPQAPDIKEAVERLEAALLKEI
ncbi:tetratricopeptide repeat protein [Aliiroseovarius sp.]|uniref:tetratricopeptide repeat protein n=1 Tax=Aliiroseovarius sp. TaxID=1872442 RepID=UPI002621B56D|nr:tetratricopeptide repeat protein [Aliiroseovarius sp.]